MNSSNKKFIRWIILSRFFKKCEQRKNFDTTEISEDAAMLTYKKIIKILTPFLNSISYEENEIEYLIELMIHDMHYSIVLATIYKAQENGEKTFLRSSFYTRKIYYESKQLLFDKFRNLSKLEEEI